MTPAADPDADTDAEPDPEPEADADAEAGPGADADADGPPPVADAAETPPGRPVRARIAAALLVLVLAIAAYEGWLLFRQHRQHVAAAQALAAAESYALILTSVDAGAIDKDFAAVLDGATGEFKHMYAQSSEQLRQLLIENKAAAHGTVIESAVKSVSPNRVEVMLFVDQSVSNAAVPAPQIDRSRIVMTMEKVDGRWLAGKVDLP